VDLLPTPWRGFMLAGFAAAYMSTVATHLNWGASYLVNDFYKRFVKRDASEAHYVAVSRAATVLLFLGSIAVTSQLSSVEKAWELLLALGAGTGLVLILRWYWWRINAWSEISAMVASFAVSLLGFGFIKPALNHRRTRLVLKPCEPRERIETGSTVSLHGGAPRGAPSTRWCPSPSRAACAIPPDGPMTVPA